MANGTSANEENAKVSTASPANLGKIEDAPVTVKTSTAPSNTSQPTRTSTAVDDKKSSKKHTKDSSSDLESGDEEFVDKRGQESVENSSEYWLIQKLIKYLRIGNQTATVIAISALRDCDLTLEAHQLAIRDLGGLEMFVNLLETRDSRCVRASLLVLIDLSTNGNILVASLISVSIRASLCEMDIVLPLVRLLDDPSTDIKCKAAETIANCAKNVKCRRLVRTYNGITKLINLLNSGNDDTIKSAARAIWACKKNKQEMENADIMDIMANLILNDNEMVLAPVMGVLQECAKNESFRTAIRSMGMLPHIIRHIQNSTNIELLTHAVNALFQCSLDAPSRKIIREANGLGPVAGLLDKYQQLASKAKESTGANSQKANQLRDYLAAVTGAMWKLCLDTENIPQFLQLGVVKKLVTLMDIQPPSEVVLVRAVGALGSFAQTQPGRIAVREGQAIRPIIQLLTRTDANLLENAARAVGACAQDSDSMAIIDKNDGVRLLWSLLRNPHPSVQASAAWAIRPCIEHARDAGEMVRSFVGGLELMVSLLKSDSDEVLAGVCAALAKIARDDENLGVMTDHGIVGMLAKLTTTRNDSLRKPLAEAIAQCCFWGKNRIQFGDAHAVGPLVKFLKSSDTEVHKYTALALQQLSMEPTNCIAMHEYGAVPLLLDMIGSQDEVLQEAAAATIGNIRKIALKGENRK